MTFTTMDKIEERSEMRRKPVKIAQALQFLVREALLQGRLTHGVLDCSQVLKSTPGEVVFCVVQKCPVASTEKQTNRKLLEAYCTEKRVRMIQVDSCRKLTRHLQEKETQQDKDKTRTKDDNSVSTDSLSDAECLLITKTALVSLEEDFVMTYHDLALFGRSFPFVAIPE